MLKSSLLAIAASFLVAGAAKAQVGTNWHAFSPDSTIQVEVNDVIHSYAASTTKVDMQGGHYSNSGGIETFSMTDTSSNRVERRFHDEYTTGHRQFQADVLISTPTNNESIHQIFNGPTGPWLIVRENNTSNGSIKVQLDGGGGSGTLTTNLYGTWFRLNSINSFTSGSTFIYVNGSLVWQGTHPGGTFYTKYGCYGTLGASTAKVQFKNVQMFQ